MCDLEPFSEIWSHININIIVVFTMPDNLGKTRRSFLQETKVWYLPKSKIAKD